jgi:cysteinyl-tRNA synthetase
MAEFLDVDLPGSIATPARALRLHGTALPIIGRARVYACGITPYDTTHLGHAATFVWVDTAVRVLRALGVEVEVCRNVTDVDDDILAAAQRADTPYDQLAVLQQFRFDRDMAALGVRTPDHEPRIHRHIEPVVRLAAHLLALGAAYESGGSVYFRGTDVPARAGLDRAQAEPLLGAHGEQQDDPHRRDPLDAVLWQRAAEGEPAWPSPWGPGRPGWHAGCTAMAMTVLGTSLDLHAGGADLRFPHHAYEAAQAEAASGVAPFSRAWMHVGTVGIDGAKMAKSAGNLVLVGDVLRQHRPAALRLLLLDRRWDAGWDYADDLLDPAEARVDDLYAAAGRSTGSDAAEQEVLDALLDDLDVPRALDAAISSGGAAARSAVRLLGLPS